MRDGNKKELPGARNLTLVVSLPMRDGNLARYEYSSGIGQLLAYL